MGRITGGWQVGDGGEAHGTVKGLSQIGGGDGAQGIYDVSTVQNFPLGYKLEFDDGRIFRYADFVSAVGPGKIAAQDASVTVQTSIDAKFTNSAGTGADQAISSSTVYMLDTDSFSTADAADVYAGGYLQITDDTGEGHNYRIKSNTQATAAGLIRLDLYDPLAVAVVSEASASIVGNPYRNLAINDANVDAIVAGVTVVDMAAAEYGWVQTKGVATVLGDGTIASAGSIAQVSDSVNGAAQVFGGGAINSEDDHSYHLEPIVGIWLDAVTDTEYGPVKLSIE